MKLRTRLKAGAFLAFVAAAVAGLLAAPAAAAADGPQEVAAGYLQARAAAITSRQPASVLQPFVVQGSALATREIFAARGAALRLADLGHAVDDVTCQVAILKSSVDASGTVATVVAHAVTTVSWHARRAGNTEASGVDHRLSLECTADVWRVTADDSGDVELPALLERAGVPAPQVRAAARRLEAKAAVAGGTLAPTDLAPEGAVTATPSEAAAPRPKTFSDRLVYDRDAARAYADKYALAYNATYVRFSGDCCNFVSQGTRAGGMPMALGEWTSGWWYDKEGTSSPGDDHYSWSWISCSRQIAFWLGTRIDWVSSISDVSRGDVVYYDWTGDGSWDHVAILAGTDSLGHKVIDAHTTDHYHWFWKLGTASTKYKFGRVRAAWVV
jgi:cell wall-associated NlpC family hydrolase